MPQRSVPGDASKPVGLLARMPAGAWILLLLLLATFLHWPAGTGFRGDDYFILRYVSDFGNCWNDFVGPQYDLVWMRFWRPLITLSFGTDHLLFGTDPTGYFAMNCAALLVAAALLFGLLKSLGQGPRGTAVATCVVLLWVVHPTTVTVLRGWAAGRVDAYYVPFLLLALVGHVRHRRGGPRWPVLAAAGVAFATKEAAVGFPLLALAVDALDPRPAARTGPVILGRSYPAAHYLWMYPVYFGWRWLVLGTPIGGYRHMPLLREAIPHAPLGIWNEIGWCLFPEGPGFLRHVGAAALVLLALRGVVRSEQRPHRLLALLLCGTALFGPVVQLFPRHEFESHRLNYLPAVGLMLLWVDAALGQSRVRPWRLLWAAGPVLWLLPAQLIETSRQDEHEAFNTSLRMALRECDRVLPEGLPVVVAGDVWNARHMYRFAWALGSVLKPPFHPTSREVVSTCILAPGRQLIDQDTVTSGLPAWVEVRGQHATVVVSEPASPHRPVPPRGFPGTLTADLLRDEAASSTAGYPVSPDFKGYVIVCTSVGSVRVRVRPQGGILTLADLLAGEVCEDEERRQQGCSQIWLEHFGSRDTWWAPNDRLTLGDTTFMAAELDRHCPFTLIFEEPGGAGIARLWLSDDYGREYARLRFGH